MEASEEITKYAPLSDNEIPLYRAGVAIALIEHPDLDIESEIVKIDSLIEKAKQETMNFASMDEKFEKLNDFFFNELSFKGNAEDYYNPRNSLLDEVLQRRTGIPITISVIYLEFAWRLGLDAYGIGFPGHFLIGYKKSAGRMAYLDPFNRGIRVEEDNLRKMLDQMYEGRITFGESLLAPSSKRSILIRMLNNLKAIYLENKDLKRTLDVLDCICELAPDSASEIRDRGLVNLQLRKYSEALDDLYRYTELEPNATDSETMRQTIQEIKAMLGKLK